MSSTNQHQFRIKRTPKVNSLRTPAQQIQGYLELPLLPMIGLGLVFLAAFFNLVDLDADNVQVTMDRKVLLKLMILGLGGLYGGYGVLTDPRVRQSLFSFPVMWLVVLFGLYCVAVPNSLTQTESLASTLSIACVILMTVTALIQIGVRAVLTTVFYALSAFVILSWLTYWLIPSIGVFAEPLPDGEFARRMGGLAHPNTLGQFSGLTIVLGLLLRRIYGQRSKWRTLIFLLAAGALIGSLSRTSMLATAFAMVVVYRQTIFKRRYFSVYAGLGLLGILGLIALSATSDINGLIESKLSFLSKSGDAEELTSATGRAEIWGYAIRLIGERPLTGYGAATSKYYLSDYSLYTHNMILNIAFSAGVFAGLAAVLMCLGRLIALFRQPHPIADALVVFILINGLFENVIFSILAGLPTIVWTIGLCLPGLPLDRSDNQNSTADPATIGTHRELRSTAGERLR